MDVSKLFLNFKKNKKYCIFMINFKFQKPKLKIFNVYMMEVVNFFLI